jgi:ketosteroid isomerase-like protein
MDGPHSSHSHHFWIFSLMPPPTPEALIRAARDRSNRGILARNINIVAESLDQDFIVIVGDGTLIRSRDEYLAAYKAEFGSPEPLCYIRTPDLIEVSSSHPLASEQGRWISTRSDGTTSHTGTYAAIWRRTPAGWKLRSEFFVTLALS